MAQGGWRQMDLRDLPVVEEIAAIVHPSYPESAEVPRERLTLFPAGCFIAEDACGATVGYAIAHPGTLGRPPALDTLLAALPEAPDCLYLHDVALLPTGRGSGLGRALLGLLAGVAAQSGLRQLALVAVNGSAPYWRRSGFTQWRGGDASLAAKLASYGGDVAYLVRS